LVLFFAVFFAFLTALGLDALRAALRAMVE
jgi:hypothetical protein